MSHKHEWVLIDKSDGKRKQKSLPKGQWVSRGGLFGGVTYIPGFDHQMVMEAIVETIYEADLPTFSHQTWTCNCGKVKTFTQRHPGLHEMITKRQGKTVRER